MIAAFMAYTMVVTVLIGSAAVAVEYLVRSFAAPTRGVWVSAIALVIGLSALACRRALVPAPPASAATVTTIHSNAPTGAMPRIRELAIDSQPSHASRWLLPRQLLARVERAVTGGYDATVGRAATRAARWSTVLLSMWLVASLATLAYLMIAFVRLRRLTRPLDQGIVDGIPVLISHDLGPALVGVMAPQIVVPRWVLELSADERRAIIMHEQEHAEARDPVLVLFTLVALMLEPWNLALWGLAARARFAAEADCDARVLRRRGDAHAYGKLLLVVYERSTLGLLPRAALVERRSNLERRIRRLADEVPRTVSLSGSLAMAAAILCATIAWSTPLTSGGSVVDASQFVTPGSVVRGFRPTCAPGDRNPSPDIEKLQGWAREFYPAIMRDSTNAQRMVIGLVLDSTCSVTRHAAAPYPTAAHDADAVFASVFPDIHDRPWLLGIADGAQFPHTSGSGHNP